jgi:SAM-dependent methyltransferase
VPDPHGPQAPPLIFDRARLRRGLERALSHGPEDFFLTRLARDLIERLDTILRPFNRILDLGTPAPILTTALAERAPALLVRAAPTRTAVGSGRWLGTVIDEETLPFAPESFDLVVSALALQQVNDRPGALAQIRQVLRPDGLFLACMLGGQSLHELRCAFAVAEEEISGGASPRVAPFADVRDLGGLLQRAGFALPVTDTDRLTVRYDHVFALLRDLRGMGATNALVLRERRPLRRGVLQRAAEIYAERFSDPDSRVPATFDIVWLSGWAPHESQQKPLRPGSARMRLAEALGAKEQKLKS